jgi:hypothetical protein
VDARDLTLEANASTVKNIQLRRYVMAQKITRRDFLRVTAAGIGGVGLSVGGQMVPLPLAAEEQTRTDGALRLSACIEMIFRDRPFSERMALVAKCGLPAIEFWSWRDKDLDGIIAKKKETDLQVSAFCVDPGTRLTLPRFKEAFVSGVEGTIGTMSRLDVKTMIVTVGN